MKDRDYEDIGMKIELRNLRKEYKQLRAVDDVSVEIEDGELVCLLGPSGCGKSTTLFMLAGLILPDGGEILFDGKRVDDVEAEKRDIGMVFQDYALYPHMTVEENIAFPLKMKKVKKEKRKELVLEVARLMQIESLLSRKPKKLSGGQQQRVAIARALVKKPSLLLLDEPLSNLDARLRMELREDIRALQRKVGITTIFVTHDQEEALSISDRILILNKGKLQQFATPREIYKTPANEFVGSFLGNPVMNRYDGIQEGGSVFFHTKEGRIPIEAENIQRCTTQDGKVRIGIRPEHVQVREDGALSGVVMDLQTLGKDVYLHLRCIFGDLVLCTKWDREFQVGETLSFLATQVHVFGVQ